MVTTIAGSGKGWKDGESTQAMFDFPIAVAIDDDDNLYVSDYCNHKIRKISKQGIILIVVASWI
jgi:hypothetical protein